MYLADESSLLKLQELLGEGATWRVQLQNDEQMSAAGCALQTMNDVATVNPDVKFHVLDHSALKVGCRRRVWCIVFMLWTVLYVPQSFILGQHQVLVSW